MKTNEYAKASPERNVAKSVLRDETVKKYRGLAHVRHVMLNQTRKELGHLNAELGRISIRLETAHEAIVAQKNPTSALVAAEGLLVAARAVILGLRDTAEARMSYIRLHLGKDVL